MPQYATLTAVAFFASLGLPGFSGFVGELFTLMGSMQSAWLPAWQTVVAALGIALAAGYFLWTLQRMFFGPYWNRHDVSPAGIVLLPDLTSRERWLLIPLGLLSLILGLFPNLVFNLTSPTVGEWLKKFLVE